MGSNSTLTDLRKELKTEIESAPLLGRKLFEVGINEDAPPAEGTQDICFIRLLSHATPSPR